MKHRILFVAMALMVIACGNKTNPEQPGGGSETPSTVTPKQPTGLKVLDGKTTETSLTFQWDPQSGVKFSYTLTQGSTTVKEGSTSNRNVKVDGLTKATTYQFTVFAVVGDSKSAGASLEAKTAGEDDAGVDPGTDPTIAYEEFDIPEAEEDGIARAFPGAEGGGMFATGGRGGKIYHVTSLDDNNTQGTLRYGIENAERPLTIVFDVAGTIALQKQLQIKKGDLTIAGQTAPGDGICLKNYTFRIHASNVIVRFIRCRMGDEKQTEDDAMQVMDKYGDSFEKIIIDHCSISWCTDECASFYGMKDFTFQWNIVSESLRNSIHDKGPHGYGGIWGGTHASYHHNLLAHHDSRNPRIDHDYVSHQKGPVSIFNNVVYNWEGNTCYGGESSKNNGDEYRKYNFFNNYYKPGPVTPSDHIWLIQPTTSCSNCGGTILPGHFYMDGNIMEGKSAINSDNWTAGTKAPVGVYYNASTVSQIKETSPFTGDYEQSIHSASDAFNSVLAYAGASYARDGIDARIAKETKDGTFTYQGSNLDPKKYDKDKKQWVSVERSYKGLIDTQTDVDDGTWVNGWPVYKATEEQISALRDADSDGIPNTVEDAWGLNKSDPKDASEYTLDPDKRYTNLEMYLHYLVKDIVNGGNQKAEYKKL